MKACKGCPAGISCLSGNQKIIFWCRKCKQYFISSGRIGDRELCMIHSHCGFVGKKGIPFSGPYFINDCSGHGGVDGRL